jgi:hypothetical protein
MDERILSKLLFRNFTVQHGDARRCTMSGPGECHVITTIPEGITGEALKEWDKEVCQFIGIAIQDAFNRMLAQAQNNADA